MRTTHRTLNLGILAHVDAGKTSLTERLLYEAGAIDAIGSVDAGSTHTDSLDLERRRGITIKSAVVNFRLGSGPSAVSVNLIDTPGHPDFIAEVERVLGVLDGAVLVVSAVEGVQPQTRVLMRTLKRLGIPTLLFINKVDRRGADDARVLREAERRLGVPAVAMGRVTEGLGTRTARVTAFTEGDGPFARGLLDVLTARDDALLAAYVADEASVPYERLYAALVAQTRKGRVHPVYVGSAITGAGIRELVAGIKELLPADPPDTEGALSGRVFKVERGEGGEKIAYARLFSGALAVRERAAVGDTKAKVTDVAVFDRGALERRTAARAGEIAVLRGLAAVRIGDVIGGPPVGRPYDRVFAPPSLETVVVPADPADQGALHLALTRLAEQDPLIGLRQDPGGRELSVSLYGEVQKEVLAASLAEQHLTVEFRQTTPICVERVTGTGTAHEILDEEDNPFLATVGLRVEPGPVGDGVTFRLDVELGSLPQAYTRAVEETVHATLTQGVYGWQVPDCVVTMTHSGFCSIRSTAGEFRALTPLVLMTALRRAGTVVHEPMHRFVLEVPQEAYAPVALALGRHRAVPGTPAARGDAFVVEGHLPADHVHGLERELPELTGGEGILETSFGHYRATTPPPTRARTDHNPLHREEYLLHAHRRM
ncbi:elongation factor G [Streptomyces spectabilis]|uniref:TetM/TetW/TetO/TetS family tetracycline resistance ribosomal protection protein n=1 Tax=Streptomyces spectabilis TaxID=68270 RepID=A0A516RJ86_STRST|nr:TetM/TetW/TetO/TetS family tetracycline resistance ribosomal protection protein [Streptomyces spectabilis]QDQ15728.1 TetM/TetW/TetO/TetS family tetracycline resistance ribosomal protection protein [Streptomyces spectabilis]